MTQEVQPLTWQKRTNIEEHQQFFSKINEIIANLAPTVNEAEQAIAQANQAIASANSAIANANGAVETANAASAAASAAASQAQTAASTVAGYDTRLTAAETKNSQQDTAIGTLQTADANNVKITGEHAIGNYAVLLTGNQTKAGNLTLVDQIISSRANNKPNLTVVNTDIPSVTSTDSKWSYPIIFRAADQSELGHLTFGRTAAGKSYLTLTLIDSSNTTKTITLGVND